MKLLKDIQSSMNFQDRYSDMEGSKGGYSRKEKRTLKKAEGAGVTLNESQSDRSDYLNTVSDERTRAALTGVTAVGGVVAGAYTGNPALVTSSLAMGAGYVGGEMAEDAAGNDGVGQQLGIQDAMNIGGPLASTLGQGAEVTGEGWNNRQQPKETKRGGTLRYNPRKYDYIKGNTFGF